MRLHLVLLASLGLVGACQQGAKGPDTPEPSAPETEVQLTAVDPPLDRQGLALAVARAASDFAAGREGLENQRALDGRRFELALKFGCPGEEGDTRQWSFDERERVLRIRVEPELTQQAEPVSGLGLDHFEAVEGFWIRRPWLLVAACPKEPAEPEPAEEDATAPDAQAAPPEDRAAPRIGIAHFFTEQDSRALRREQRAYQATVKLPEGRDPSSTGYDLVLSGRLDALPDGRTIACSGGSANAPPSCIVSVTFDRITLRHPDGELLAEWSKG